jgi:hypothetical protein
MSGVSVCFTDVAGGLNHPGLPLMGIVSPGFSCAGCDAVLLRVVTTPAGTWLDLRGLTYLRLPVS